jgi:DNA modification methylase
MRWWADRGYVAPHRDVFQILGTIANMRYSTPPPKMKGSVHLADARQSATLYGAAKADVSLIVTSPPYIDTTDYSEDQWLRLWFLGGEEHPRSRLNKDDRHTSHQNYWKFLSEVWASCSILLKPQSHIVIRIGGKPSGDELLAGLMGSLRAGFGGRRLHLHNRHSSIIQKRQTNVFRPGTSDNRCEHDFVFYVH